MILIVDVIEYAAAQRNCSTSYDCLRNIVDLTINLRNVRVEGGDYYCGASMSCDKCLYKNICGCQIDHDKCRNINKYCCTSLATSYNKKRFVCRCQDCCENSPCTNDIDCNVGKCCKTYSIVCSSDCYEYVTLTRTAAAR